MLKKGFLLAALLYPFSVMFSQSINLIPTQPAETPNYWCTWNLQNFIGGENAKDIEQLEGSDGAVMARNILTEKMMFSEDGWANKVFPEIRKDLILVFDDGWDVPPNDFKPYLGSQIVDSTKFPSCSGKPEERLKKLNELTKKAGWKGAGIWICAQEYINDPEKKNFKDDKAYFDYYWTQRLRWSAYAGIKYWKVDWGSRAGSYEFRKTITDLAKKEAPQLIIEHIVQLSPINNPDNRMNTESGRNGSKLVAFSDVFRTYDVTAQLSASSTLDRLAYYFQHTDQRIEGRGLLHCEDEVYIGATLGVVLGIMRYPATNSFIEAHPFFYFNSGGKFLKTRNFYKKSAEVTRAVNWQKIMPAFSVYEGASSVDKTIYNDSWHFVKGETWDQGLVGKTIIQGAPASIARGICLPQVTCEGEKPYVVAAQHPNGSVAVASLGRTTPDKGYVVKKADVKINIKHALRQKIGIFGYYKNLTIVFDKSLAKKEIWAQDLAASKAVNITKQVKLQRKKLIIPGTLIEKIGKMAQPKEDESEPGLVIMVKYCDRFVF